MFALGYSKIDSDCDADGRSKLNICSANSAQPMTKRSADCAFCKEPSVNGLVVLGRRCPIVGRISMDMMGVDITDLTPHSVVRGTRAEMASWSSSRSTIGMRGIAREAAP